jgi:hypothetical protein
MILCYSYGICYLGGEYGKDAGDLSELFLTNV